MNIAFSTEKATFAHRINIEHTLQSKYMPDASYDSLLDFSRGLIYMTQVGGTALLWTRSTNGHRLQRRAAWLMTYLLMLSTFNFYVYFINNFLGTEMRPVVDLLQATAVPVFLFLLMELTAPHRLTRLMMAANYLPYLFAVAAYWLTTDHTLYNIFLTLIAAHCCGILAYGFIAVKRYNRRLLMTCSNTEHLDLRWLRFIFYLFVVIFVVWFSSTLLPSALSAICYNLLCAAIFLLLCFFVSRQENMTAVLEFSEPTTAAEVETQEKDYHFEERFEQLFQAKEIYLNPDLTIVDLATALGTNRTYVSNYINQKLHTTYYQYVNSWRLRRAADLLTTTTLSLDEIAQRSGFNSRSSFRRNFIQEYGITPGDYRGKAKR